MSGTQLKAFMEIDQLSTNLQERPKAFADTHTVLAIAKDAGFSISADDLKNAQSELSDEELEGAAGGAFTPTWFQGKAGFTNSICWCFP